jgi:uncharacterized protein (DUF2236 family)
MATALRTPVREQDRTPRMHDPDSMTIRCAADIRMQLMGGRTFVMQVAHPAVGAGVHEFSEFRTDPWTRLEQIAKSGTQYLYRGEAAAYEEGRRLQRVANYNYTHLLNLKGYGYGIYYLRVQLGAKTFYTKELMLY